MAMTKKEAAAHKEEIDKLKLRLALCWTPKVEPDVLAPSLSDFPSRVSLVKGWLPMGQFAEPACSSRVHHGTGSTIETRSQGSRNLYSTRLLALMAARNELELRFARELMSMDARIEAEKANPTPLPDK